MPALLLQAKRIYDLKERGHERTRELGDSHRLVALGLAAAKIIHDLANPLNAISTSVQLIERSLAENSDGEALTELVQGLKEENARVQALMEELRQFARPLELKLGTRPQGVKYGVNTADNPLSIPSLNFFSS